MVEKSNDNDIYGWLTNPFFRGEQNLTVTFWVKMDATIETDIFRNIVKMENWVIAYNGKKKMIQAFIAYHGQGLGTDSSNPICPVPDIGRWTFVALVMSPTLTERSLYLDGNQCDTKNVNPAPQGQDRWGSGLLNMFLFFDNKGISLIDELKFYKDYFDEEQILEEYIKEKKEFMS